MPVPWNAQCRATREARISKLKAEVYGALHRQAVAAGLYPAGPMRCAIPNCDCGGTGFDLTVGHIDGCTWDKRAVNEETRLRRYKREIEQGIRLRLECNRGNGRDGRQRFQGRPRYRKGQKRGRARWTPDPDAPANPRAESAAERAALDAYLCA